MNDKKFISGLAVLAAGLFASSISSFLEHFTLFGTATDFARGLFDGLSAVACAIAILVLVISTRRIRNE